MPENSLRAFLWFQRQLSAFSCTLHESRDFDLEKNATNLATAISLLVVVEIEASNVCC